MDNQVMRNQGMGNQGMENQVTGNLGMGSQANTLQSVQGQDLRMSRDQGNQPHRAPSAITNTGATMMGTATRTQGMEGIVEQATGGVPGLAVGAGNANILAGGVRVA